MWRSTSAVAAISAMPGIEQPDLLEHRGPSTGISLNSGGLILARPGISARDRAPKISR